MKKIYVLLLALFCVPFIVNAEDILVNSQEELKNAINSVETNLDHTTNIVLNSDITTNTAFNIESGQDITIVFNGKNLTIGDITDPEVVVKSYGVFRNHGNLSFKMDSTKPGLFKCSASNASSCIHNYSGVVTLNNCIVDVDIDSGRFILNAGDVLLSDGVFNINNALYFIENSGYNTITFNGGVYNMNTISYYLQHTLGEGLILNIDGGVFNNYEVDDLSLFTALTTTSGTIVNINEAKFNDFDTNPSWFTLYHNSKLNVKSGTFNINNLILNASSTSLNIEGGIFNLKGKLYASTSSEKTAITIGKNDGVINEFPRIITEDNYFADEVEVLNFYDGTITGKSNPPFYKDKTTLNTLPSYNVKDNNNRTYTMRLVQDSPVPDPSDSELETTEKNDTEKENPNTGVSISVWVIAGFALLGLLFNKISRSKKFFN